MALSFGTSGVRGLVTEFTDQQVYLLTSAFLKYSDSLKVNSYVATGRDLRDSSPKILKAVHNAISDYNKQIYDCGQLPTPSLAYYSLVKKSLAIMVTGSHIPADRNGVKFYLESGETLKNDDQAIFELYLELQKANYKSELFNQDGSFIKFSEAKATDSVQSSHDLFVSRYLNFFKKTNLSKLKVIFYEHSSVARDLIPEILEKLGATVIRIGRSNTFIPVDTEAVESLSLFQKWITEHNADVLVSTDGDGDRPLIVDNKGRIIQGDKIGMITSQSLSIEAVALPISCNSGISQISQLKEIIFTKIGSPFVVDALDKLSNKYKRIAGFEANGGYILKSDIINNDLILKSLPTRDSVLPIISLLSCAKANNVTLSELVDQLPKRFTSSILVKNCPPEISSKILENVTTNAAATINNILVEKTDVANINTLDGIRISTTNHVTIHFRPSGNAPEFRCYIEAETQEKADLIAISAQKFLHQTELFKQSKRSVQGE